MEASHQEVEYIVSFACNNHLGQKVFYTPVMIRSQTDRAPPNTSVYIHNITYYDAFFYIPIDIEVGPESDVYISGLTIRDLPFGVEKLFRIEETRSLTLENVKLSRINLSNRRIMVAKANTFLIKNFTISQLSGSSLSIEKVIEIEYIETLEICSCSFTDVSLAYSGTLLSISPVALPGSVALENMTFSNHYLSATASLIKTDRIRHFTLTNSVFKNISSDQSSSFDNVMINLEGIDAYADLNVTLKSINATQTNIQVLEISMPSLSQSTSKRISITDFNVFDSIFTSKIVIASIYNIISEDEFAIELDQLRFTNLTFDREGLLLNLQSQTPGSLVWTNLIIQEIEYAGIYIGAYDLSNLNFYKTIVQMENITANNIYARDISFIEIGEGGILKVSQSDFRYTSNVLSGSVMKATDSSLVSIFNSEFHNNTSIDGGVFELSNRATIQLYGSTISNNFAISSGVAKVDNDAHFEFYNSYLYHNFGHHSAVTRIFSTVIPSVFDNCTIENNIELSESGAKDFCKQGYIHPKFKEYVSSRNDLFEKLSWAFAIEVIIGSIKIQNGTVFTNQDNALYSVYSTTVVDDLNIRDTELTFIIILIQLGSVSLNNIHISNISAPQYAPDGRWIIVLSDLKFEMNNIELTNSVGHLLHVFFSQGSIRALRASNVSGWFLIYSRSSEFDHFEDSHFESISTSHEHPIRIYKSKVESMKNITLSYFNNLAMHVKDSQIYRMDMISIANSPAAIHAESSTISMIDNLRVSN